MQWGYIYSEEVVRKLSKEFGAGYIEWEGWVDGPDRIGIEFMESPVS